MFKMFGGQVKTYLKLNKIFRQGYLPSRGGEKYFLCNLRKKGKKTFNYNNDVMHTKGDFLYEDYAGITNCFEHACFNLKNEHLINFNIDDLEDFFSLPELADEELSRVEMFDRIQKTIQKTGLKVKKCKEKLEENEWNVAMYVSQYNIDVHFLLQEKDGSWSGKFGQSRKVDYYSILPLKVQGVFEDYNLFKVFTIENPYIITKTKE